MIVSSRLNYDPFGMLTVGRSWSGGSEYRYGFNGKEQDDETAGNDVAVDFGARIYDGRLGRWLSVDPLQKKYADLSSYCFVGNMPIIATDPTGKFIIVQGKIIGEDGKERIVDYQYEYQESRQWNDDTPVFVKQTFEALDKLYSENAMEVSLPPVAGSDQPTTLNALTTIIEDTESHLRIEEGINGGGNNTSGPSTDDGTYQTDVSAVSTFNPVNGIIFRKTEDAQLYESHKTAETIPDNLGRNSPTSILGHEIFHAYNRIYDLVNYKARKQDTSPNNGGARDFPNKEEDYVTKDLANQMNKKLGESERVNYGKIYYPTETPTSTKPGIKTNE